jgi:phosphoribosyl 1,2-cyclic phosphodiesterase
MRVRFLGTGPAGGRPGSGRSHRLESSALITAGRAAILIDVTRDFAEQARWLTTLDLALITHPHRDASGGLAQLARWTKTPLPVWSAPSTIETLRARYRRLEPLQLVGVRRPRRVGDVSIAPLVVPHAADCTTVAWRIAHLGRSIIYASDLSRLDRRLARCDLLIVDGATWKRRIFTHLEIERTAQVITRWPAGRVLFTQLGRSTPEHAALDRWLRAFDPRFGAAHDGLEVAA